MCGRVNTFAPRYNGAPTPGPAALTYFNDQESKEVGIETDWEQVDTSYGVMRMYTARPEGGTAGPGVLIVSDSFGLTPHIEEVSRRFAAEGIVALAPDLYHKFPTRT